MADKVNYQKELDKVIGELKARSGKDAAPTLLLHACCAPCSSYVLEYLRQFFAITVFFYNPNITESDEYERRVEEETRLITALNEQVERGDFTGMRSDADAMTIGIRCGAYVPEDFFLAVKGVEASGEGGERCTRCFRLRLEESARVAAAEGFDFFTTTLTISPLKDAARLNAIGEAAAAKYGTRFLPSDFKKKNGYLRSTQLSEKFKLYRQDYCGCVFSKRERENR